MVISAACLRSGGGQDVKELPLKTYTFHEHVTTERKLRETKYQSKKVSLQSLFYSLGLILLGAVGLIFFSDQKAFAVLFGICIALGALFPLLPWLVCEANRRQLRIHGVEPMDYTHELDEEGLHYQFDFLSDQRTLIPYSSIKRVELYENLLFFVPKKRDFRYPNLDLAAMSDEEREALLGDLQRMLAQARQEKTPKKQKKESDFWDR